MKQQQINTTKDEAFEVLGKKKTSDSSYSLKNAVTQKTFPLASKRETFVAANNIFKSGKIYPISPQNAYEAQEVRGLALDKLIQNTSKTHTSENFNRNNAKWEQLARQKNKKLTKKPIWNILNGNQVQLIKI